MVETASFGAGCFWQVEVEFRNTPGVLDALVGYMGGELESPTYEQVCTARTGHAEVVEVKFDPEEISYEDLLEVFWGVHDPTQMNRQGPDVGPQYRSAIFVGSDEQRATAEASKKHVQQRLSNPIATTIEPASTFWEAEDYHQRYLEKRGLATCRV